MTKKLIAVVSFALFSALAWALPTTDQVQAEVNRGNYTQAESMMREVVQAKPNSAKAHYIYAEILAHNANFSQAAQEVRQAQQIDPDIKFAQPDKFRAFQQLLDREQNPAPTARAQTAPAQYAPVAPQPVRAERSGIPSWIWLVLLAVVGWMLWRGFSRSRAVGGTQLMPGPGGPGYGTGGYGTPGYGGPGGAAPYGGGYGPGMPQQGTGGSLLGTGLAVAGGVAAGMAVDEMLHRNRESGFGSAAPSSNSSGWLDAPGGNDQSARELEDRPIDFGNGGGWDAGGGGSDSGGGGGSDDGGWN